MKKKCTLLLTIVLGFTNLVFAQQNDEITSTLEVFRISVNNEGEEVAEETTAVAPGDMIEYRLTYSNISDETITQLYPVLPVPIGMEFEIESASPALEGASLSNSGNNFQKLPLTRQVRQPDGTTVTVEVPSREYRRLRWMVPSLDAGEQVFFVARVEVIKN